MIEAFAAYIKTITALTIFSALTELLLPESRQRRYAQLILGIFILTAVLQPLFQLMGEVPTVRTEWEWTEEAWKAWSTEDRGAVWDTYKKYTNEG